MLPKPILLERLGAIEQKIARIRPPRDGLPGDAGPPGIGEPGPRGDRGPAGKDADPELIACAAAEAAERAVARIPVPRDGVDGKNGVDGKDVDAEALRLLIDRCVANVEALRYVPKDGATGPGGPRGSKGAKGDKGDKGEQGEEGPAGPRPDHEWDNFRLRFELPSGRWGKWQDLRGPPGYAVGGGGSIPAVFAVSSLTQYGVVLGNGNSAVQATGAGPIGYVLTGNGPDAPPTWQESAGGTVGGLSISGTATVGSTLTAAFGTGTTGTVQWYRDGVEIAGETDLTYVIDIADEGTTISARSTTIVFVSNDIEIDAEVSAPSLDFSVATNSQYLSLHSIGI